MTVDKINTHITNHQILNDRLKEAASGKKNQVQNLGTVDAKDANKSSESIVFSDDAKKLQETEVILRNALQKLHEMDEIHQDSFGDIKTNAFQEDDLQEDHLDLSELIFPEEEMRSNIQKRMKADEFVEKINEFDKVKQDIDYNKIDSVKQKIATGFYNQPDVADFIAEQMTALIR